MIKKINTILDSKQKSRLTLFILSSLPLIFLETISISSLPIYLITILNPSKIFEYIDHQNLEYIINAWHSLQNSSHYYFLYVCLRFGDTTYSDPFLLLEIRLFRSICGGKFCVLLMCDFCDLVSGTDTEPLRRPNAFADVGF